MTTANIGGLVREVLQGNSAPVVQVGGVVREVLWGMATPVNASQVVREVLWGKHTPINAGQIVREVLWGRQVSGIFTPPTGAMTITGVGDEPIYVSAYFEPGPALFPTFLGLTPELISASAFEPPTGHMTWIGHTPIFIEAGTAFKPPTGHMFWGPAGYPELIVESAFDWQATVISQYANSPSLIQMVINFDAWIAPGSNLEAFYDLIWNLDTAQGYGLDVWGRIVGVGRVIPLPGTQPYFGFEESTTEQPFNQAPFYRGGPDTSNYILSDATFRVLILAKALANICNGSIPAINQILINLFPGLQAYCTDGEDMTMTYTFTLAPTPVQLSIVENSGVLPKPAGVSVTVVHP